jgi:hypothetical protein
MDVYHFIQPGRRINKKLRAMYRSFFLFILTTFSAATWLISLQIRPSLDAILVFAWNSIFISLLLVKPQKRVSYSIFI